jgi:hypothetical protein
MNDSKFKCWDFFKCSTKDICLAYTKQDSDLFYFCGRFCTRDRSSKCRTLQGGITTKGGRLSDFCFQCIHFRK